MTGDVYSRAKDVFGDALDVPPARRKEFAERACAGDATLLAEVLSLLGHHEEMGRFLERESGAGVVAGLAGRFEEEEEGDAGEVPSESVGAQAPGPAPATGTVLAGRYELLERLGAGAFGAVHRAHDRIARRDVAVKVLPLGTGAGGKLLRREVATLRRARLPGLVEMLDDGIDGGHAFIVMRLVEGRPFPGSGAPRNWDVVGPRAHALCEALGRLHWLGIVHGDVKPDNVLVGEDGRVTLLDLGVAWEGERGAARAFTGRVVGTPRYLAPECLHGFAPSFASDLYAVGVLLFEAISGTTPHTAATFGELVAKRDGGPAPSLATAAPEAPGHVVAAVDALLAVDPADRPASVAEALARLRGQDAPPALRLPRIGGDGPVDDVVAALRAGRSIDVGGPSGAGRTRLLEDVAARLARDGFRVAWARPAARPFESLSAVIGAVPPVPDWRAADARRWAERRLQVALDSGVIVLADDVAGLDPHSAEVLSANLARGRVARVVSETARAEVMLRSFAAVELRSLFRGPDRIHHLREDGANELFARTGGLARDVARELTTWIDQGYARFEDDLVVVDRAAIDRLAARVLHRPEVRQELAPRVSPAARALATLLALAGRPLPPAVVGRAAAAPPWEAEMLVDELVRVGAAHRREDGRVEAVCALEDLSALPAADRGAIHSAVADALPPSDEHSLAHLLAADRIDDVPRAAVEVARAASDEGAAMTALTVAAEGCSVLRRQPVPDPDVEEDLLECLMDAAISAGTADAIESALYHVGQARTSGRRVRAIEDLCRAALLAVRGDGTRALEQLASPFDGRLADLEPLRHDVRAFAARSIDDLAVERRVVFEAVRRPRTSCRDERRAQAATLTGWLRYRQGRYRAAANLHARRARLTRNPRQRVTALLYSASASLEASDLDGCRRAVAAALPAARALRHPLLEARAERLARAAAYRAESADDVDVELVDAVRGMGANLESLILLNEAAVAWRLRKVEAASRLAEEARARAAAAGDEWIALLARALLRLCTPEFGVRAADDVVAAAARCPVASVAAQAMALVAPLLASPPEGWKELVEKWEAELPAAARAVRSDVLSYDEVSRRLREGERERSDAREEGHR